MFFYIFAAGIVGASLLMVTRANVIHAALSLVLVFLFMAGIFVLAGAEFLAGVQILIYAGGIMVLYLFSIMLMNVGVSMRLRQWHRQSVLALAAAVLLAVEIWMLLGRGSYPGAREWPWKLGATPGNVEALGQVLYTKFLFPFEVASVLLLASMIGAIVLAKRQITR